MEKSTGRKTRQLEVVWHEVAGDNSHPTADQIYQRVRRHIPNISFGTVYHDLQKLMAEGKLQVLTPGSDAALRSAAGLAPALHLPDLWTALSEVYASDGFEGEVRA